MQAWNSPGSSTPTSNGCAYAPEALDLPMAHTPNLVMIPGRETLDFTQLVGGLKRGVAIKYAGVRLDFQQLNGWGRCSVYEVKDGKRVAALANGGVLLRAPEFWKSLIAIGGPTSVERYGAEMEKGEPPQTAVNSVDVIPVMVKDLSIIDVMRKA